MINNDEEEEKLWERRGRSGDPLFREEGDLEIPTNGCAGNAA